MFSVSPFLIKPGEYKKIFIKFQPLSVGIHTVTISLNTNFGKFDFSLTGTGVAVKEISKTNNLSTCTIKYSYDYDSNYNLSHYRVEDSMDPSNNYERYLEYDENNNLTNTTTNRYDDLVLTEQKVPSSPNLQLTTTYSY